MVKRWLLALALVGVLAAGCTPSGPREADMTIGLTYVPNIQFAPYYVAMDKGYFLDEGISVELRHHGQDEDLFGALTRGVEDVVVAGGAEMVQAHQQGIDAVTFQTLYINYPVTVIVPEDSEITSLQDLDGRTLGVPGRFGETWFGTLAFLQQVGLSEDEVKIEEIGFTQQAALAGGHVDAVVGYANNDIPQFASIGLDVRAVPSEGLPLVGVGIGAPAETIKNSPEKLQMIAAATYRAIQDIAADPDVAIEAAKKHIPGAITPEQEEVMREVIVRTTELYGPLGSDWGVPDLELWAAMISFMDAMELIDGPVDLEAVVTNEINGTE